jgi:hypothetical protein
MTRQAHKVKGAVRWSVREGAGGGARLRVPVVRRLASVPPLAVDVAAAAPAADVAQRYPA